MSERIRVLPTVALRGMTILPEMIVHFDISRDKSIKALEKVMMEDQHIFLVSQKDTETENPQFEDLYKIGTIAVIKQVIKLPHNILRVLAEGKERAQLLRLSDSDLFLEGEVACFQELEELQVNEMEKEAMVRQLKEIFAVYAAENQKMSKDLTAQILEIDDLNQLVDQIAVNIHLNVKEKQKILEAIHIADRYEVLSIILTSETEMLQIRQEIQAKVKERVDKNQREYILREQLKLIREELGEDNVINDAEQFAQAVQELAAPEEVKEKILKEIERFKSAGQNSAETGVIRGYIETLLEMPWDKESRDSEDLKRAEEILEEDHYGLEKVKERVLEFLAVRSLTKKGESPILCLAGPPGTGKTSIARSIARALDKEYVRISLGGVRDEAEIRGHRRTYIGAMPGRIASGIKQSGVKNPLMLFDEIDKMSSDYKGDTASAMLEVLDSEQNYKFRDHYIELPIDLSEVLFIATANNVQAIPKPLLDRMELIEVSSYTENEKKHIAKDFLIPKQLKANGLDDKQLSISHAALGKMIRGYTKESGVRNLERKIGDICRKAAREILQKGKNSVKITETNLEKFLGKERYSYAKANKADQVGIARGLAWTSVGGDTLEIEVNVLPGKGSFVLTGQMGDVMKESARTGISYIRSISSKYGIAPDYFSKTDIHIHIPEGAVPKDGPSAGITMAVAMLSAITEIPVYAKVAMTGEITLRGRVLPIGGLKEKLLAAKNAGIEKVLVPEENKADVLEIASEIKKGMDIVFVNHMEDVLKEAGVSK